MIQNVILHTTDTGTGTEYGFIGWSVIAVFFVVLFGVLEKTMFGKPTYEHERRHARVPAFLSVIVGALYLRYFFTVVGVPVLPAVFLGICGVGVVGLWWNIKRSGELRPPACDKCGDLTGCENCGWTHD